MSRLIQFSIPVEGLSDGIHQFDFQIDDAFFAHFEDSPIKQGAVDLKVLFEKRPDMKVLYLEFEGTVGANCDRCLSDFQLPVSGKEQLIVKSKVEAEVLDDPDVIFVADEDQKLDVSTFIYEFICLAIPLIKVCEMQLEPLKDCDEEMLAYLDNEGEGSEEEASTNPIWEELKAQLKQSDKK